MNEYFDTNTYMNKRVRIKSSDKTRYIKADIIGKSGTVIMTSACTVGVLVDGKYNKASGYGVYWFDEKEIKIIENESEDIKMEGFKNVAIVNLIEDSYQKDYGFAIYDTEYMLLRGKDDMVVVNARGKNKRVLGIVKDVVSVEDYYSKAEHKGLTITAEVVGVVNMNGYIARETEKVRLAELEKKKAAIERELEAEINKRKSVEYYEAMAQKYSDNPKLAELVVELKNLGA